MNEQQIKKIIADAVAKHSADVTKQLEDLQKKINELQNQDVQVLKKK